MSGGKHTAAAKPKPPSRKGPSTLADCYLIAAAPDLLAACEAALSLMEQPARADVPPYVRVVTVTFDPDVMSKLRAAIKKARGE